MDADADSGVFISSFEFNDPLGAVFQFLSSRLPERDGQNRNDRGLQPLSHLLQA